MRKNSRSQWRRARADALRVELLEERKLLNGRDNFASGGFVAVAEWPDEEIQGAEKRSPPEVDDGEVPEVESADRFVEAEDHEAESEYGFVETDEPEVEWGEGPLAEAGDLSSYYEAADDSSEEVDEVIAWSPRAAEDSGEIERFEDEHEQFPVSQPSGQDAGSAEASSPAATSQVSGDSSNSVNSQGGNSTPTPPSTTTPPAGNQFQPPDIDEADEAFEATHVVAQSASESHTASEARSPLARQAPIRTGPSVDVQAEAARASVTVPSDEGAPTEPAANRDSAAPPVSTTAEPADAQPTDESAPAVHATEKANPNTSQPRQKEAFDSPERVETSAAAVEPAANKSLGSYSVLLVPAQLPVAAIVDAILATPPQVAGLLTDFISIDMASIEREIDNVLGQLDGLRRELAGSLAELNLPTWFLAAAVGAAAAEVVRLQRRRAPGALAAVVRNGDSSTWLPDSAGPAPEELT